MSEETKQQKRDTWRRMRRIFHRPPQNPALASQPLPSSSTQRRSTSIAATASPSSQVSHPPSPSRSFSEQAISSLPPDDQVVVRKHLAENTENASNAVEEAYRAALVQRQAYEDKKLRIKFRGNYVVLRDEADKVVKWIEQFIPVGDVIANVDPVHVGLPWAGIRIILQLAIANNVQRAALLAGMNLAMHMTSRIQVYLSDRARFRNTLAGATFEKALVKLYAIVLRFFDRAADIYQKGFHALKPESELTQFEGACREWAMQVGLDADNAYRALSQQERDEMREWMESTLASALDRIDTKVSDVLANQQDNRYQQIIAWLSPPDPISNHDAARNRHEPETGDWLLRSPEYQDWQTSYNTLLWLTGSAGCGKTVLCSTVIEDVRSQCRRVPNIRLAFFYFSFSDKGKQSYTGMLSSLIVQLSQGQAGSRELQNMYNKRTSSSRPSTSILEETLSACIQQLGQTVLVLDALDELPEDNFDDGRRAVLKWIGQAMQSNDQPLKIFVTSRQQADIRDSLRSLGARHVVLHPCLANNDIQMFVAAELEKHPILRRLNFDTKRKIEKVFEQKADGMFRWAFCQLETIKKLKSTQPKDIELVLHSLPSTLDETYERMLLQIDERQWDKARTALRWLAFETRPLTLGELADACLINYNTEQLVDVDNRGQADDILEILAGVVVVEDVQHHSNRSSNNNSGEDVLPLDASRDARRSSDQEVNTSLRVRLAHFSVKEYLLSDRIADGKAAYFALRQDDDYPALAQSCLAYMLYYCQSATRTASEQDLVTYPLLEYAASTWPIYIPKRKAVEPMHERQLLCTDTYRRAWVSVHRPDEPWRKPFKDPNPAVGPPLYYASLIGTVPLCESIIKSSGDVNAQGGYYGNALQAASCKGNSEVVQLLLDKGADINAQGGYYGNALRAVSCKGYREGVQLLLDKGAEVNARGGAHGNALQAASFMGNREVVQLLLDKGADINAQGGRFDNALCAASYNGYREVVQLLLDKGAEVNAQGDFDGNALQTACSSYRQQLDMVQLLLDKGAEVNAQGGCYGSALQAASERGHREVVLLLLGAGAKDIE